MMSQCRFSLIFILICYSIRLSAPFFCFRSPFAFLPEWRLIVQYSAGSDERRTGQGRVEQGQDQGRLTPVTHLQPFNSSTSEQ